MSEKFRNGLRKIKEGVNFGIEIAPAVLLVSIVGGALGTGIVAIDAGIKGVIASVCWNFIMTTAFDCPKVTIFQMFVFFFAINLLKNNYFGRATWKYAKLWENNVNTMIDIFELSVLILMEIIFICIGVNTVVFYWNNILTQLLNAKLVQINFWEALGFGALINLLFRMFSMPDAKK